MKQRYLRDPESRVWLPPGEKPKFWYTDGESIERDIYQIVAAAADVSADSAELTAAALESWPRTYHLSPVRTNLLRGFDFSRARRVLEIGCGCGALTRYLGEKGLDVVAVEPSVNRARIAAERCRDLANVTVVCDGWERVCEGETFDLILVIGVLEYAGIGSSSEDPAGDFLKACRAHLSESGSLLLAIENRLGLKYLAGHLEDHTAKPYWGVERHEQAGTPQTFGKRELEQLLVNAHFGHLEFYFPFPDYKLPSVIVGSRALETPSFSAADLLLRNFSRSYNGAVSLGLDESLARYSIEENGLLHQTANSFLIIADTTAVSALSADWLAKQFNFRGPSGWNTMVSFELHNGAITARKQIDASRPAPRIDPDSGFRHIGGEFPYEHGRLLDHGLRLLLARGGGPAELSEWVRPWLSFLDAHRLADDPSRIPGTMIDAVPFNFVRPRRGEIRAIDQEWAVDSSIPLSWIFIRGLGYSLSASPRKGACAGLVCRDLVRTVATHLDLELTPSDFDEALRWEAQLQGFAYGTPSTTAGETNLARVLAEPLADNADFIAAQLASLDTLLLDAHLREAGALQRETELRSREATTQLNESAALSREEAALAREATLAEHLIVAKSQYDAAMAELSALDKRSRRLDEALRRSIARRRELLTTVRSQRRALRALETHHSILSQVVEEGQEQLEGMAVVQREKDIHIEQLRGRIDEIETVTRKKTSVAAQRVSASAIVTGNGDQWSSSLLSYVRASFFDEEYYRAQFARALPPHDDAFDHFLRIGWREGKRPHPLFDTNFYLRQRPDLIVFDYNPLLHFIRYGAGERRNPHPLFDVHYYLSTYRELLMDEENPLEHFIYYGLARRLNPCGYFDTQFYLSQRPDLEQGTVNPLVHYIIFGWKEGVEPCPIFSGEHFLKSTRSSVLPGDSPLGMYVRSLARTFGGSANPHPLFHTQYYYAQGTKEEFTRDPLLHFLRLPPDDPRSPCPLFDPVFYRKQNHDVSSAAIHPFMHYLLAGAFEGRQPHPMFDVRYYYQQLERIRARGVTNPLAHYFSTPFNERLSPHPDFDPDWYRKEYRHALRSAEDPLLHFIQLGRSLGFAPGPVSAV